MNDPQPVPYIDMHCHSTYSDGSLTPGELIDLAGRTSLSGLCITDHDTINAYPEAIYAAHAQNIEMISGVEFSALQGTTSVHLLGYSFAIDHPRILKLCQFHQERRQERNAAMLKKLKAFGMEVHPEELLEGPLSYGSDGEVLSSIGRPHIAAAMVRRGYIENVDEGFKRFLGDGKPCYVEGEGVSVEETLATIQAAGGFGVIAHPHLIRSPKIVAKLLDLPFDGVEVYYAHFPFQKERPWLKIAEKKKWLITGGSDFHGDSKPHIYLGASWIDQQHFAPFLERFYKNNPNLAPKNKLHE
ncbi:MAG: PHP domain-containing protein [Chlamydiia bacterium]|nr:PHP domain-containing protein [Chlamydiia bacterium]